MGCKHSEMVCIMRRSEDEKSEMFSGGGCSTFVTSYY